jgi:carboxypeptidase C (cathepsin A)
VSGAKEIAMPHRLRPVALLLLSLFLVPALAGAQMHREAKMAAAEEEKEKAPPPAPEEVLSSTSHQVVIGGETVRYTATAGNYVLAEEDGTPKANVFFIAYTRDGVDDPRQRPVLFSFNGGPGSSSVWLHLGLFGPRRVAMEEEGWAPPPPYRLVDNEHSLLDLADLVFIDPVTTGFSRAVPVDEDKQFHGVEEDIASVGDFIRLWVARNERWASPKIVAGESYGTTRAAGLSGYLQQRHGMYLNGVVLVSSILDFQTARFDPGNDLPYLLFLPTYTATAWYHGQLPEDLQQGPLIDALDEAESFALGDYALALLAGDDLPAAQRRATVEELARLTGLSREYVDGADLRPQIFRFTKELLREEERTVGRLDSRFTGIDRDAVGESFEFDPSMAAILGPYGALLNDYVRRELGYESDLPYEILTGRVHPWSFADFANRYVNVAETLRQAMTQNPYLKVFVASGYFDLATPYFATEYTFDHLGLDPTLTDNVEIHHYEAGHMMYIRYRELVQLKSDLAAFLAKAIP